MRANQIEILVDAIGRAAIPVLTNLLLCGHDIDEFAKLATQIAPAALHVLNERLTLVLGHQKNLANTRVHAIGERKVDDAELTAKRRCRLTAIRRQIAQALTAPARHDNRQGTAGEPTHVAPG